MSALSERRSATIQAVRPGPLHQTGNAGVQVTASNGLRYRLHGKALAGRSEFVFGPLRNITFIHRCFWHGHDRMCGARSPETNTNPLQGAGVGGPARRHPERMCALRGCPPRSRPADWLLPPSMAARVRGQGSGPRMSPLPGTCCFSVNAPYGPRRPLPRLATPHRTARIAGHGLPHHPLAGAKAPATRTPQLWAFVRQAGILHQCRKLEVELDAGMFSLRKDPGQCGRMKSPR